MNEHAPQSAETTADDYLRVIAERLTAIQNYLSWMLFLAVVGGIVFAIAVVVG